MPSESTEATEATVCESESKSSSVESSVVAAQRILQEELNSRLVRGQEIFKKCLDDLRDLQLSVVPSVSIVGDRITPDFVIVQLSR